MGLAERGKSPEGCSRRAPAWPSPNDSGQAARLAPRQRAHDAVGSTNRGLGPLIGWKPKSLDPMVASARIRCMNPLSELQRRGYPVELFRADRALSYQA